MKRRTIVTICTSRYWDNVSTCASRKETSLFSLHRIALNFYCQILLSTRAKSGMYWESTRPFCTSSYRSKSPRIKSLNNSHHWSGLLRMIKSIKWLSRKIPPRFHRRKFSLRSISNLRAKVSLSIQFMKCKWWSRCSTLTGWLLKRTTSLSSASRLRAAIARGFMIVSFCKS